MPYRHFHVDLHDVGFQPDPDSVSTHMTIDGALDDATTRAEEWLDQASDMAATDPLSVTRGSLASSPHTYVQEIVEIDAQVQAILHAIATDEDYTADIARKGLLIVLEDGVAVIELVPCSEDTCETYRKDWIE